MSKSLTNTLVLIVLFIFTISTTITAANYRDRGARLKFFVGQVEIKNKKGRKIPAKLGMKLRSGYSIRTMIESRAEIKTPEGTMLKLNENTTFLLAELLEDKRTKSQRTKVKIAKGSIWFNVKKLADKRSSFKFETPTATAAIRGTEGGITVSKGGSDFQLAEGELVVRSKAGGNPVTILKNQKTTVKKGQKNLKIQSAKPPTDTTGSIGTPTDVLVLEILSPTANMIVDTNLVLISGKTAPGASVKIGDKINVVAGDDGMFSATVLLSVEEGPKPIEITAVLEDLVASSSVSVIYQRKILEVVTIPLILDILLPAEGAKIISKEIKIEGKTLPNTILTLSTGATISVGAEGSFTSVVAVPEGTVGEFILSFSAVLEEQTISKDIKVEIVPESIKLPLFISIASPLTAQVFTTGDVISFYGNTLPGAKITVMPINKSYVSEDGSFSLDVPAPKPGDYNLQIVAELNGEKQQTNLSIKVNAKAIPCVLNVNSPSDGDELTPTFKISGECSEGGLVTIKSLDKTISATVSGNKFSADIVTGFSNATSADRLALTILEPKNGALITSIPVLIKGKVVPAVAKLEIDGKSVSVSSSGDFVFDYYFPDENGDYSIEAVASTEKGEAILQKYDFNVSAESPDGSKCENIPMSVQLKLGEGQKSDEAYASIAFSYEKPKEKMVLNVQNPICSPGMVKTLIETNAREIIVNGKNYLIPGSGKRSKTYEIVINDLPGNCISDQSISVEAIDESMEPDVLTKEVTWDCSFENTQAPDLTVLSPDGKVFTVKVSDQSFKCDLLEEEVTVVVKAGSDVLEEFLYTSESQSETVEYLAGANIKYTVIAKDKGNRTNQWAFTKSYLDVAPAIKMLSPSTFSKFRPFRKYIAPGTPGSRDIDDVDFTFEFRIENIDDAALIKRVEFRYLGSPRLTEVFEGSDIKTDLEFSIDYTFPAPIRDKQKIEFYEITVIDVMGNIYKKTGEILIYVK